MTAEEILKKHLSPNFLNNTLEGGWMKNELLKAMEEYTKEKARDELIKFAREKLTFFLNPEDSEKFVDDYLKTT
jgi:hypothetical protein